MTARRVPAGLLALCASTTALLAVETTLVPAGATWKYLDDGSDRGTNWQAASFADGDWSSGPAQLGYGDNGEVTEIEGGPVGNRYITSYFRHAFTVASTANLVSAEVSLIRDDGVVVYLNGSNVFMSNITAPVDYLTQADTAVGGSDESTWHSAPVPVGLLEEGTNVIGAEVHQANPTSSDVSFDLRLTVESEEPTHVLVVTSPHGSPVPGIGSNLVVTGSVVNFSMPDSPVEQSGTQFVCVGWTGTGSIPSGTGTSSQAIINTNSSIAWHWSTNTWLTTTAGVGGTVAGGNTWTPTGGTNIIAALAGEYAAFSHWEGDTAGLDTNQAVLAVTAGPARSLHAVFTDAPDAVGLPDPPVVEFETTSLLDRYTVALQTNALSGLSASNMPAGLCYNAAGDMLLALQAAPPAIRYYGTNGVHLGSTTQLNGFDTPRGLTRVVGATNRYAIGDAASADISIVPLSTGTISVDKSNADVFALATVPSDTLRDIAHDAVNDGLYVLLDAPPSGSRVCWASVASTGTVEALTVFTPSGVSNPDGLVRDPWSGSHIVANADGLSRWDHTGALQGTRAGDGILPPSTTLTLTPGGRELTMLGEDASLTTARLAPPVTRGPEGTPAQLFVALSRPHAQWIGVPYTVTGETAVAGADFSPTAGTVWIRPGRTRARFDIQRLTDDVAEDEERLHTHLGTPSNASLGRDATHTVAIESNDMVAVVVESPFGVPTPPVGTNNVVDGSTVSFSMADASIPLGVGTQLACVGWTGTGSIPTSGEGTSFSRTITTDSSIDWVWKTNVLVSATNTAGGRVFEGGWSAVGETRRLDALVLSGYRFTGWAGDVPATQAMDRPLLLAVTNASSVTATFAVALDGGTPRRPVVRFAKPQMERYEGPVTNVLLGGPSQINFSGVAYMSSTDELLVIANNPTRIQAYDTNGVYQRPVTLSGFSDTESICPFLPEKDLYAVLEETSGDITIATITTATTSIAKWNFPTVVTGLAWDADPNKASEGITYDPSNRCFYVVKEKSPIAVDIVFAETNTSTSATYSLFDGQQALGSTVTDVSDVRVDIGRDLLYVLSDESKRVLECTFDGSILGQYGPLTAFQPEGLGFRPDGEDMYVVGEANEYFRYERPMPGEETSEGTVLSIPLELSRPAATAVTVEVAFSSLTAVAGIDYTPAVTQVTFAAGTVDADPTVTILRDQETEPREIVVAMLSGVNADIRPGDEQYLVGIAANTSITLTVSSEYGSASPPTGIHHLNAGESVFCEVTNSPVVNLTTQYNCIGWTGTDDVPSNGTGPTAGSLVLYTNSGITWTWTTNLLLDLAVNGAGALAPTGGWYRLGTNVQVMAAPAPYFYFAEWSGDVASGQVYTTEVDFAMSEPHAATAIFAPYLATNGTPHWWLAEQLGVTTGFDTAEMSDPDADEFLSWEEYLAGTIPTNYASALRVLSIAPQGSGIAIQWPSVAGREYTVYRAGTLAGPWDSLTNGMPAEPDFTNEFLDSGASSTPAAYRVNAAWPPSD